MAAAVVAAGAVALPAPAATRVPNLKGQWTTGQVATSAGAVSITVKITRQSGATLKGTACETPAGGRKRKAACSPVTGTVTGRSLTLTATDDGERVAEGSLVDAAHAQVSWSSPGEWFAEAVVVRLTKG